MFFTDPIGTVTERGGHGGAETTTCAVGPPGPGAPRPVPRGRRRRLRAAGAAARGVSAVAPEVARILLK